MKFKALITVAAASSAFALAGCDIDKTQDGELPDVDVRAEAGQLPKYEVDVRKTQDGRMPNVDVDVSGGNLPEYDVDGPDVRVGTKKTTIQVPDVDVSMKDKTITVPDVDVDLPDDENDG